MNKLKNKILANILNNKDVLNIMIGILSSMLVSIISNYNTDDLVVYKLICIIVMIINIVAMMRNCDLYAIFKAKAMETVDYSKVIENAYNAYISEMRTYYNDMRNSKLKNTTNRCIGTIYINIKYGYKKNIQCRLISHLIVFIIVLLIFLKICWVYPNNIKPYSKYENKILYKTTINRITPVNEDYSNDYDYYKMPLFNSYNYYKDIDSISLRTKE